MHSWLRADASVLLVLRVLQKLPGQQVATPTVAAHLSQTQALPCWECLAICTYAQDQAPYLFTTRCASCHPLRSEMKGAAALSRRRATLFSPLHRCSTTWAGQRQQRQHGPHQASTTSVSSQPAMHTGGTTQASSRCKHRYSSFEAACSSNGSLTPVYAIPQDPAGQLSPPPPPSRPPPGRPAASSAACPPPPPAAASARASPCPG